MVYGTYGLFLFLNFIFALRRKHSKLLLIITFIFILIMFTGYSNVGNGSLDFYGYVSNYDDIGAGISPSYSMEIGYVLLMKIGNMIGMNFFIFKIAVSIVCFLLIFKTISQFTRNYNCVCFLYLLYPILIDTERFRNFIGFSIFIYAIRFLVRNTKKDKLKYVILILFASTFHVLMFSYLIFVLVDTSNKNKLVKYIVGLTIVLCFIAFINHNNIPGLGIILRFVSDEKLLMQMVHVTRYGFIIPFSLHLMSLLLIYFSQKNISRYTLSSNSSKKTIPEGELSYINFIFWIDVLSIIYFPLYMLSYTFSRLATNLLLLNFIAYAKTIDLLPKRCSARFVIIISTSIILIAWLISEFFINIPSNEVFIPFFQGNVFFN